MSSAGHVERSVLERLARAARPAHRAVFTQLTPDLALRQAREADARRRAGRTLGPLDGVVVTCKDVFDLAGTFTTSGSRTKGGAAYSLAETDAACVALLQAAGAITLGKTNLSEFAFSGLGLNPHFGTATQIAPRTGRAHLVGGSSSGAAAAVARGLCQLALATDTSGSVRVPAAWCGLVGFRPTQGRYCGRGVARLARSLDTVGVIAGCVADILDADSVLHAPPLIAPHATPTFVLVDNFMGDDVDQVQRAQVRCVVEQLQACGHRCEARRLRSFDQVAGAFERYGTLVAAEAAIELGHHADDALVDPFVRHRLRQALALPPGNRAILLEARSALVETLVREAPGAILVFPTTPMCAPVLGDLDDLDHLSATNQRALRHTMIGSFLDMPSITLPCGHDADGLPVGVTLACGRGDDARLLAAALRVEALLGVR